MVVNSFTVMDNHYDREAASKTLTAFIEHKQAKFPTNNGSKNLTKLGSVQVRTIVALPCDADDFVVIGEIDTCTCSTLQWSL